VTAEGGDNYWSAYLGDSLDHKSSNCVQYPSAHLACQRRVFR